MAKRLQDYEIGFGEIAQVMLPAGAQVLSAAPWGDESLMIMALIDDEAPLEVRDFFAVSSLGENDLKLLQRPRLKFITAVEQRPCIWHIFEAPRYIPPPVKETVHTRHLWEMQPPDPCEDQNFHHNTSRRFWSWLDFMKDWESWDHRMAYLFRWDWVPPRAGDEDDSPIQWTRDEYYRESNLRLFFVFGGRGIYSVNTVSVCRADEPSIREWLVGRYEHLLANWGGAVDITKTVR